MRKILIKFAYKILQHYCIEDLPYIYCDNCEYKIISAEINPIQGYAKIYAERKQK